MRVTWIPMIALAGLLGGAGVAAAEVSQGAAPEAAGGRAAPAAANIPGYEIVRLPNANVGNFTRRVVSCPGGKRAIGGGAEAQGADAILVGSFPTDDGAGWVGLGRQNMYSTVGISVFVVCAYPY